VERWPRIQADNQPQVDLAKTANVLRRLHPTDVSEPSPENIFATALNFFLIPPIN
jgi:hypothetical protein